MARGWESKSVEDQQSEFGKDSAAKREPRSPEEEQRLAKRQAVELGRAHVQEQLKRSQNPRYTEMLNKELQN